MEDRKPEYVIALCRKGISETFDQPGDEIYCIECTKKMEYLIEVVYQDENCIKIKVLDRAAYQWLIKSDLELMKVLCTDCGKLIIKKPGQKMLVFWESEEEDRKK